MKTEYLETRMKTLQKLAGAWRPEHTEEALDTYWFEDYFDQVRSAFSLACELDNWLQGEVFEARNESEELAPYRRKVDEFLGVIGNAARRLDGLAGSVRYFEYDNRKVAKEDMASLLKSIEVALHPERFPYQEKAIANGIAVGEEDVKRGRTKEDA